jgi:hypothetical protein
MTRSIPFTVTETDGRQVTGEVAVPDAVAVDSPYRRSAVKRVERMLRDPRSAAGFHQRVEAVVPGMAAQLQAKLPPVIPAHFELQRAATGLLARAVPRPATPASAVRAEEVARRLAPFVVAEEFVSREVAADLNRRVEEARKLARRVAELESMPRGVSQPGNEDPR